MERRDFIRKSVLATAAFTIVPRHVLGGAGFTAPSDQITKAIVDGRLIGTIFQDPPQLGKVSVQELLKLIQQPHPQRLPEPKEVLVAVKRITKENLPSLLEI